MSATDEMVQVGFPPGRRPPRLQWWVRALIVLLVLVVAFVIAGFVIELPYYSFSPGSAQPVDPLITVPPGKGHQVSGQVLLTDVEVSQVRLIDYLPDLLSSDTSLVRSSDVLGGVPPDQFARLNSLEMTQSQQAAEVAALRRLGYTVPEQESGALVAVVVPGSAAQKAGIQLGDTVTKVDGSPVLSAEALTAALHDKRPGEQVTLAMLPATGSGPKDVVATLGKAPHSDTAFLGVSVVTTFHFDLPFQVKINSQGIGGPSAGLSWTLGIIDKLAGGELTGGTKVAATGTIDSNGNVGDVGGVQQKTVAVRDAGAALFLVPPQELGVARAQAGPKLKVVAVSTLNQALDDIASSGGSLAGIAGAPPG